MKIEKCLSDYWQFQPELASLLKISQEQLKTFSEKGVINNSILFFRIALFLEDKNYKVDGYSDLPETNRDIIKILISEKATVEDYLKETRLSRDAFTRNLRGSRFLAENGQRLVEMANAKFMSGLKSEIKNETESASDLKSEIKNETESAPGLIFNLIVAAAANAFVLEKELNNYLATSTEGDRKDLRDKLLKSQFGLFPASNATHRLSQKLNALCSEKALENYRLDKRK